jgi:hypothetical protein
MTDRTIDNLTPITAREIVGWTEDGQPRVSRAAFESILATWERDRTLLLAMLPLVRGIRDGAGWTAAERERVLRALSECDRVLVAPKT